MPRPTSMTPEVIQKLEESFLLGCSDMEACLIADICPATLYNYQEKHPEFLDRKESLKTKPIYLARRSVVEGIQKDAELALKFLERKKKDEFSTKVENDLTTNGKDIVVPILGGLTQQNTTDDIKE